MNYSNPAIQPTRLYNPYNPNGYIPPVYPAPQQLPPQIPPVPQPANNQQSNQNGFNIIPVASLEEARGITTPMDGTILFMPDIMHGKIYSKQLDSNVGVRFNQYVLMQDNPVATAPAPIEPSPAPVPADTVEYAAKTDFDNLKADYETLKADLIGKIGNISDLVVAMSAGQASGNTNQHYENHKNNRNKQ